MAGLGERVRAARSAKGFSQKELADKVGVSQAQVSQIENDKVAPSDKLRAKLEKVLKVELRSAERSTRRANDVTGNHDDDAKPRKAKAERPAKGGDLGF